MPTYLGKYYDTELIFTNAYDESLVTPITTDPTDLALVKTAVERQFNTMRILKTKIMKSLQPISGSRTLLLTTKVVA
jgi:hypothetical protein